MRRGEKCVEIEGAAWPEYVPNPADVGFTLRSVVQMRSPGGQESKVPSSLSPVVAAAAPSRAAGPGIFGSHAGGQLLALGELWYGTPPFEVSYQWLQCDGSGQECIPIMGASQERYTPTKADLKSGSVVVEATAKNDAGVATARSKPFVLGPEFTTLGLCDRNPGNAGIPTISPTGTMTAGGTLVLTAWGEWLPTPTQCSGIHWAAWFCNSGLVRDDQASYQPYVTSTANNGCNMQFQDTVLWTSGGVPYGTSARSASTQVVAPPPPPNYQPHIGVDNIAGPAGYTTNSNGGGIYAKYADPEGQPGTVTVKVYAYGTSTLLSQQDFTVASGDYPPMYMNTEFSGHVEVRITARDNLNLSAPEMVVFEMWATGRPAIPTLELPLSTAVVTSVTPTLKASTSDLENDRFVMQFRLSSVADCANASGGQIVAESSLLTTVPTGGGPRPNVASWRMPEGKLQDGATYYWCARAADLAINWNMPYSDWSGSAWFTTKVPGLGTRASWPVWQRGPLAVNEATGNLVVSMPSPSYPTGIGDLGVSVVYNSLDARGNLFGLGNKWLLGTAAGVPKLVDHNLFTTTNERFDAIERVNNDGSSDYYQHVGNSNSGNYQSQTRDLSQLTRNADNSWTLVDPDGSVYSFAATADADKSYRLTAAEVAVGKATAAKIDLQPDGQDRIGSIRANMGGQVASTLTLNWACAGALLCVGGPDGRQWRYIGEGGATGRLAKVTLCWASCSQSRDLARVTYTATGDLIASYETANDIADSTAVLGSNWRPTHSVTVAYNAQNRVQDVTDGPIRRDLAAGAGTDLSPKWSFTYVPGNVQTATGAAQAHPAAGSVPAITPGATRLAAGYTEMCPPRQQPGCAAKTRVYYDSLWQTLETKNLAAKIAKTQFDVSGQLVWSEDELGKPTDVTFDSLTGLVSQTQGPDPDGVGTLGRITTSYRYDEKVTGTVATPGAVLQGVQASYYSNQSLSGRPTTQLNDADVDETWAGVPTNTTVPADGFSVRWRGLISVPADGWYRFSTVATGGTRLYVDGMQLIDLWGGQTAEVCSGQVPLTTGKHQLVLEYKDSGSGSANVQLRRTAAGGGCSDGGSVDGAVVAGTDLTPNYANQTSTISPKNTDSGSEVLTFAHFREPWLGVPEYTLVKDGAGADLVTSFAYDAYNRVLAKVMPKGNEGVVSIDPISGDLSGTPNSTYQTSWQYYGPTETASQDAQCGTSSSVSQAGLLKQLSSPGTSPVVTAYDQGGRPLSVDSGTRIVCRVYTGDGRLDQEGARKDGEGSLTTTQYSYDFDGNVLSVTEGGAAAASTTVYNEAGWPLESEDASAATGAKARPTYDLEGNVTQRAAQMPDNGATYTSSFVYDGLGRVTSQTDPAGRQYSFYYDDRNFLFATQYPNSTFQWRKTNDAGWVTNVNVRHGTLTSPTPGNAPADSLASSIVDYAYEYFQNGQRKSEDRQGGTGGSAFGTAGTTTYGYDPVGRLETVLFPGSIGSRRYCFDKDSNRTGFTADRVTACTGTLASTYAYSATATDRLTQVTQGSTVTAYGYDADGNVTSRGADSLTFDRYGRLSGVSTGGSLQYLVDGATTGVSPGSSTTTSFGATSNLAVDASGSDVKSVSRYTATATGTVGTGRLYLGGTGAQAVTLTAADADDGTGFKGAGVYANLGAAPYTVDDGTVLAATRTSAWQYFLDNAYVRFDTSSIPDGATVTGATLKLEMITADTADALSLVGDYYDFGGEPSVNADFTTGQQSDAFTTSIGALTVGAVNSIALDNLTNVSKTGWTGIRLKASQRAGDAAPTGHNDVLFAASEHATGAAPQLVVTYTVPQDVRMVVYANTAGAPGSLLAQSAPRTFPSNLAPGWQTFSFPTPPSVTNATDYWVGLQWGPGGVINAYKDSAASGTAGTELRNADAFTDGASSTFGTPTAGTVKRSLDLAVTSGTATSFDSTLFANGWHTLTAVATGSGRQATSAARVVRVQNGAASVDKLASLGASTQTGGAGMSFGATSNIVVDGSGSDKKSVSRYTATATGTVGSGRLYLGGTTQTVTLSAADVDDGSGFKGDPVYASLGAAAYSADDNALIAVSRTSAWQYFADNAYVRFDTSGIPDGATVMSAKLRLDLVSKLDADGLSLVGDYYDFGGEPSVNADFTVGQQADAFTRLISTMSTGVNTIDLANLAGVSKTGWTGIRLKESQRAGDAAPSGLNEVLFGASEHTSAAAPQLEVTYTVPQDVRMVIYANNAGAPGALLAQSTARTFPSDLAPGWQTFIFPTPPTVTSSTDYWVGLQWGPGAVINAYKDSAASGSAGTEQSNTDTFSDGAASSFGTPTAGTAKRSLELTVTGAGGSSTAALTTTNAAPVGSTVIVAVNAEGVTLSSVTDSRGNTYTIDRATVTNANSTAARVSLASSRLTTAVQAGDTITATFSAATASVRSITAAAFSGLLVSGTVVDVGAIGTSATAGTAPASSATAATAYATELVIGAVGAASTATLTPGSSYASAGSTSGTSGATNLGVHLEWKTALSKAPQTATGTLSASSHWAAAVQTYKPLDTTAPGTPGTPTATGGTGVATVTWTASAESGVMYHVHRGTVSTFTPAAGNEIGQTTTLTYTDNGDGTTNGLPAGSYYYKVTAEDVNGNTSPATASNASAAVVTADTGVPKVALTAPAALAVVSGPPEVALAATTDEPAGSSSTIAYGFDPAGFRINRSVNGSITHRYLLGGLIETDASGTLTFYDVDGPLGDLAHYSSPPTSGQAAVSFIYYNAHGDLAAEASLAGTRTIAVTYDPFGAPLETTPANTTTERWTGQWDKKLDTATGLIEMGARPYDPSIGRFYTVDPIEGGSCNAYDYACQDPINAYDLDGKKCWGVWFVKVCKLTTKQDHPHPSTHMRNAGLNVISAQSYWIKDDNYYRTVTITATLQRKDAATGSWTDVSTNTELNVAPNKRVVVATPCVLGAVDTYRTKVTYYKGPSIGFGKDTRYSATVSVTCR